MKTEKISFKILDNSFDFEYDPDSENFKGKTKMEIIQMVSDYFERNLNKKMDEIYFNELINGKKCQNQ